MSYRDQLKQIGVIPSIEHFFNYYVFLKKPSDMPKDIDIFFFRNSEVPMWEVSYTFSVILELARWRCLDHKTH